MLHERHYTLEQANAVRGWVAERVRWIRDARARLVALGGRGRDAVGALETDSGGSYPGREVAGSLVELSRALGELEGHETPHPMLQHLPAEMKDALIAHARANQQADELDAHTARVLR